MAPRFGVLLLLLPAACAAERPPPTAALNAALDAAGVARPAPPRPPRPRPVALHGIPSAARDLLGATPEALQGRLGEPVLIRREGGAEIWRYSAETCHLDLVLYPARGALRVGFAAARAEGTARVSEAACLQALGSPRPARGPEV